MYLDDLRTPVEDYTVVVRNYQEAYIVVKLFGIPNFISFDYDLGFDIKGKAFKNGYDFAKWLVQQDIKKTHCFPDDFTFKVHSQNPEGSKKITTLLESYCI
ncbi:hypothetical protein MLC52_05395 [Sulfurimonas sp. NW15]|uniref:cyclic-phosphate processing receiver domain-containing protein n=1 Tax=Sulfurimonas sp. NW15 TaxID=2922729 RepID=UPI003DA8859F